jgi:hypothetical protein
MVCLENSSFTMKLIGVLEKNAERKVVKES